jgi:hypothetical protein
MTTPNLSPNLYLLQGHQLHITYSTTGFDGNPHFTYQDARHTLNFVGKEIRTLDTEIGTLVSVTIVQTVDTGSTTFTLLVPKINLGSSKKASVKTEGITTIHRFSIIPIFNQGQTEIYSVIPLSGSAELVAF